MATNMNNNNNSNQVQIIADEDLKWLDERINYLVFQPLSFAVEPLQGRSISPAMRAKIVKISNSKGLGPDEQEDILKRIQFAGKFLRAMWREKSSAILQVPQTWHKMMGIEKGISGLLEETIEGKLVSGHFRPENPTEEDSCCICLAAYLGEERTGRLHCSHVFHWECAVEWLKLQNRCPVCKKIGLVVGRKAGPAQK